MSNFQERKFELLSKKFEAMGQKMVHHQSGYLGLDADPGDGRQNQVGVTEQFPQGDAGDIAQALAYVQQVAEQYPDDFCRWAATSDILQKADSGASVRKAGINRSGQTRDPLVYPANAESSQSGVRKTITTDELSNDEQLKRLVASAEDLIQQHRMHEGHLRAKILHVSKL
jgi:hypothetical protein